MKFMEKAKRFFTLNAANHEGFTLVELIVVIAILAILAGVAVPVYSGYIKKAEKAADLQLLAAVNDAFAAACMVDEKAAVEITSAFLKWDGNKVVGIKSIEGADLATVQEAFDMFYGDNKNSEFKYFEEGKLQFANGVFMDVDTIAENGGGITVTYAGSTITVSAEALAALQNSSFKVAGSTALLGQVNSLTDYAKLLTQDNKLEAVFGDDDFIAAAMNAVGATDADDFADKTAAIVNKLVDSGMSLEDAQDQVYINAAILYAAQSAVTFDDDQIATLFSADGVGATAIVNNLKTDGKTAEGMAQATLVYGMYTAYANSEGAPAGAKDLLNSNPVNVLQQLNDPDFIDYVNSTQGQNDMVALQSALDVIVDSTNGNPDATADLMINGFNNKELQDVLDSLIG